MLANGLQVSNKNSGHKLQIAFQIPNCDVAMDSVS